ACGVLATGSRSVPSAAASAPATAPAFGRATSANALGPPLVVQAGHQVVVDLPLTEGETRWETPRVGAMGALHGHERAVTVRPMPSRGADQRFLVSTTAPATVVLEAQEAEETAADVPTGTGTASPSATGPAATWALELEVERT
ncbi:MAG: hypothetical protein ACRDV8_10335, partial [Acidimicrobiales bacterium]